MGLAQGGGTNLGNAQGTITINTTGVSAAVPVVAAASAQMTQSLTNVGKGAKQAQSGFTDLARSAKQVAGAFGVSLGVAGIAQLARYVIQVDATATAYKRQSIAALSLAGSQAKLNELLVTYEKATGGVISKAQSLSDVVKLQAIGFASTTKELDQFARAARGISIAVGVSQEYVVSQLTLAIANQSFMRLDQIGLDAEVAKKRIDELKDANSSMTDSMAYRQAILEQAKEKFGALADSAAAGATGAEKASKSWDNLGLAIGTALGPGLSLVLDAVAEKIEKQTDDIVGLNKVLIETGRIVTNIGKGGGSSGEARVGGPALNNPAQLDAISQNIGDKKAEVDALKQSLVELNAIHDVDVSPAIQQTTNMIADLTHEIENLQDQLQMTTVPTPSWLTGVSAAASAPLLPEMGAEERAIHLDWGKGMEAAQKQADASMLDEETSFGASRAKTVADYNKSVARDEAAYARGRLRQNMDFLDALADVGKDATRREQGMANDLARTQGQAQADSAERVADIREDANKRLVKLDEDYEKDRLKRAQDLSDNLLDAAGDLDAKQVYQLQRDAAKQEQQASDAHDDARKEIGEGLEERLDDERKSLEKSLKQQQDNYDRQIEEGRENDRIRIQDMKDAFAKSQAQAEEDHRIQVAERAEDQAAQLTELDTQHGLRIQQIKDHASEERAALAAEADAALVAAKVADDATRKRVEAKEKLLEDMWDKYHKHIEDSLTKFPGKAKDDVYTPSFAGGGYVPSTGLAYLHRGEYVMPARNVSRGGGGRNISMGDIHISVAGTNASAGDIGRVVRQEMMNMFEGA